MKNLSKEDILPALGKDVDAMRKKIDNQIISYESWKQYYKSYKDLITLGRHFGAQEIIDLGNELARSLVDADVECLYSAQIDNLKEFKAEIKESIGHARKLESK